MTPTDLRAQDPQAQLATDLANLLRLDRQEYLGTDQWRLIRNAIQTSWQCGWEAHEERTEREKLGQPSSNGWDRL